MRSKCVVVGFVWGLQAFSMAGSAWSSLDTNFASPIPSLGLRGASLKIPGIGIFDYEDYEPDFTEPVTDPNHAEE